MQLTDLFFVIIAEDGDRFARNDRVRLGFALGPRINAGGRVGRSDLGVRLLITQDKDEALPEGVANPAVMAIEAATGVQPPVRPPAALFVIIALSLTMIPSARQDSA